MNKISVICAVMGGLLANSLADFALLEDFESYSAGAISPQSTSWSFDTADSNVASETGNKYLQLSTVTNGHVVFNDGNTLLADNSIGTYFFRARMPVTGSHNGTGVSATEGYQNGWSDGGAIVRLGGTNPGSNIYGYNEGPTGPTGGTYPTLTTDTTTEFWYNLWVVLDNSGEQGSRTYDVYIQRDGDANFDTQQQIGSGLYYRWDANTVVGSIESLYFRNANDGVSADFDDLYFDGAGENLINPIPEPATLGLVAVFGGGVLFIRRRFMM